MIRLETSKRNGIDNVQEFEISTFYINWSKELPKNYPKAVPRTGMSALYNCHGLTFASRRTRVVDTRELQKILRDDNWNEVELRDVLAGDIVIYFAEDGEANHSGIVVDVDPELHVPLICSKWGHAGEYLHHLTYCPSIYGPSTKFYRCRL
jgi:hypothetical protein